jgi:hypothetical protein
MRIPFTPAAYEHAARFVGRTPSQVSRGAELLFQAHRVIRNYLARKEGAETSAPQGFPAV